MQIYMKNNDMILNAEPGARLLDVLVRAGVMVDAPCGGKGKCGKCLVLVDGKPELACGYRVQRDITVEVPEQTAASVLTEGLRLDVRPDGTDRYALAFDLGTTTVVALVVAASVVEAVVASTVEVAPQVAEAPEEDFKL